MADTGWLTATAARTINIASGAWINPTFCYSGDNFYADSNNATGATSDRLNAYTFGAAVPGGSIVAGIEVRIERKAQANRTKDATLYLMDDTATKGGSKADTGTFWPSSDAEVSYGGAADLWGAAWTAAQVNTATFGIGLQVKQDLAGHAYVDRIQVKIYYTGGTTAPTSIFYGPLVGPFGGPV